MPVLMFLLVLAIPVTAFVVHETDNHKNEPPKLCSNYNVHEGKTVEGPCK